MSPGQELVADSAVRLPLDSGATDAECTIAEGEVEFTFRMDERLDLGVGVCGKDGQYVPVGVGIPTIRIDRITVGGTAGA